MKTSSQKRDRAQKPARPRSPAPATQTALFNDPAYQFTGIVADRIVMRRLAELRVSKHQARTHDEAQIATIMGCSTASA